MSGARDGHVPRAQPAFRREGAAVRGVHAAVAMSRAAFRRIPLQVVMATTAGCASSSEPTKEPSVVVTWGERSCPVGYAEGPYPGQEVFFGRGGANVPLPPVFADESPLADAPWPRQDLRLDGTPSGVGKRIVYCEATVQNVIRVTATAPLTIEREQTWTEPPSPNEACLSRPTVVPNCRVVQRVVYPVDAP
jgi:hypothetical protein